MAFQNCQITFKFPPHGLSNVSRGEIQGAVAVLYKAIMATHVEITSVDQAKDRIWLRVKRTVGTYVDLNICLAYFPPEKSTQYGSLPATEDLKDILDEIELLGSSENTILCGNFNARTGNRQEGCTILNECLGTSYDDAAIPVIPLRKSMDSVVHTFGKELICLCSTCDHLILNGRSDGDDEGQVTYCAYNTGAAVDGGLESC
jgi:hypothetical protein